MRNRDCLCLVSFVFFAWACSDDQDSTDGQGATAGLDATGGETASGGGSLTGGASVSSTTGGTADTGGNSGVGGQPPLGGAPTGGTETGGLPPNSGGTETGGLPPSSGGTETGGLPPSSGGTETGGAATGGAPTGGVATGGTPTGGTSTGGVSTGGASTGGGGSEDCVIGQTSGNEVVIIGESFIAASSIPEHLAEYARAQGSLQANESYIDNSVSGTTLANDQIPSQYRNAQASNDIRFVVMDGGGNDCLQANNPSGALSAAESLFETMAQDGVEKVQYFFYPDPLGSFASGSLRTCLDELRPQMQALCEGLTAPKCYFLDLRPTWNGHDEYTSDGIHPTEAGSVATAEVVWEAMVENCVAQ